MRPLCLLDHVFNNTVSDMSWDGLELTISSICGRVLLVQFDDDEFGKPVTGEDMVGYLKQAICKGRTCQQRPCWVYCAEMQYVVTQV